MLFVVTVYIIIVIKPFFRYANDCCIQKGEVYFTNKANVSQSTKKIMWTFGNEGWHSLIFFFWGFVLGFGNGKTNVMFPLVSLSQATQHEHFTIFLNNFCNIFIMWNYRKKYSSRFIVQYSCASICNAALICIIFLVNQVQNQHRCHLLINAAFTWHNKFLAFPWNSVFVPNLS